jgi:eukaryotic-like serine/threonine-protein kinase
MKTPPERYSFGPFELDCRTRELWRGDEALPLTPKAFDVLQVLVRARDRVVEKNELMKLVWRDSFVTEDSVTQNIATLRKALGDLRDRPQYILTVPRYGYRFITPVRVVRDETAGAPEAPFADRPAATRWTRDRKALLAVTIAAATAFVVWLLPPTPSTAPALTRFIVAAPEGTTFSPSASFLAVSPNGRLLAFLAARPGEDTRLWVRSLDSLNARELAGTDGALGPFWSPDSQSLGFFAQGQLKTVNLLGEPPRILCDVEPGSLPGATWSDGGILFSQGNAISRISPAGGVPARVTSVDARRGETAHLLPQFLPDGRHFIYVARGASGGARDNWIVLRSIDEAEDRQLIRAPSQALYTDPGYLLFLADGALLAQPFDATRRQLQGAPLPVAEADHVGFNPATPRGMFSVSSSGTLAYRPSTVRELGWFDRMGRSLEWIGAAGRDSEPALSPDGHRVAVSRYDPATSTRNIWILDLAAPSEASPFTSRLSWATCPLWSPDGASIVFTSDAVAGGELYEKRVNGATEPRALPHHTTGCPLDWSPDGRLLYARAPLTGSLERDVWFVSDRGDAIPTPVASLQFTHAGGRPGLTGSKPWARLSPNGRWMAYASDVSGHNEIYVRSFPSDDIGPWQISVHGGIEPQWRADGRELFFIGADKYLMAVPVTTAGRFRVGTAAALFPTDLDPNGLGISGRNQYVVSASGERFLMNQSRPGGASPPVTVLLNWTAALKR